jgi:hypothetical protein
MSRRSDQPSPAARRALVAFQIFLVLATLLAPIPVAAEDPTADPSASAPAATEPAATPDPTPAPTEEPTPAPTEEPAAPPTEEPAAPPAEEPASPPAEEPSVAPTDPPAAEPSDDPSSAPTEEPTAPPTEEPTAPPPSEPTTEPSTAPEPSSPAPTAEPSAPVAAPRIKSDLEDYPPGGLVTLTGTNWQPGESVHIFVNDDWGSSWSRNVDVIADESGNITDQFNLPNWFVAQYSVTATGMSSGGAHTTFTDSNPGNITVAAPTSVPVQAGSSAAFGNVSVAATGNAAACNLTLAAGGTGVTGLPTGATASFGSNPLAVPNGGASTTLTINTLESTLPGTYTFRVVEQSRAGNCQGSGANASGILTVTINKANQATLSITAPTSATYGDADATITTTGGSGTGALSFSAGSSTACSIVSGKLHVVSGTGTCSITATKAADANYNATTSDAFTVSVNKANQATLSITAPTSATYGDADATITTTGGSGTGALSFSAGSSTACSIVSGKLHVVSGTGTCSITATKAADADFNATTSAVFTVTIAKRTLTITADDQTKTYGDTFAFDGDEFDTGASQLVNGDTVTSVTLTSTGAAGSALVGDYPIVASDAVGTGLDNYEIGYVEGNLEVTKRTLTITADDQTKTYGDTFAFDGDEFDTGASQLVNGDTVTSVTLTSTGAAGSALVGDYPIVASDAVGTGLDNYEIGYVEGNLEVSPKALIITADALPATAANDHFTRPYGQPDPTFTVRYDGFVNSETPSVLIGTLAFATTATPTSVIGSYPVTPSGLTSTNYTITFVAGTLDITTGFRVVGFDNPVDMTLDTATYPRWNLVQNGRTVPLKFRVFKLDGTEVTSTSGLSAWASPAACDTGYTDPVVLPTELLSNTGLMRTGDRFHFNWAVPKGTGKCYQVFIKTVDGSTMIVGSITGTPVVEAFFQSK